MSGLTHEQAGLVWMAAFAFNMGIAPRKDRDPQTVEDLAAACRAMKDTFNFHIESPGEWEKQ